MPQRSVILPEHIMFHLAPGITYGRNAPNVLSLSQSKWRENVKKKYLALHPETGRGEGVRVEFSPQPEYQIFTKMTPKEWLNMKIS